MTNKLVITAAHFDQRLFEIFAHRYCVLSTAPTTYHQRLSIQTTPELCHCRRQTSIICLNQADGTRLKAKRARWAKRGVSCPKFTQYICRQGVGSTVRKKRQRMVLRKPDFCPYRITPQNGTNPRHRIPSYLQQFCVRRTCSMQAPTLFASYGSIECKASNAATYKKT